MAFGLNAVPQNLDEILAKKTTLLITDGASRGNPGPSGWAFILLSGSKNLALEKAGFSPSNTNNRMEILASLEGLRSAVQHSAADEKLILLSDSKLLIDSLGSWRFGWKKRGWCKADGNPVVSQELWPELDRLMDKLKPTLQHIDAHKGHPANDRCDELAVAAAEKKSAALYSGALDQYPHFKKIYFEKMYPSAQYLCWNSSGYKVFNTWPEAEHYLRTISGGRTKKIFSPEEIELIIKA